MDNALQLFTDASKTEISVGFEVIIDKVAHKFRLLTQNSTFTTEALVVEKAIKLVTEIPTNSINILTDSLSTLKTIQNE